MKVYEATTVSRGIDTKYKSVPQIRLQGAWLENNCGFEPGTNIKVLCEEGRLVIERC
ncbi:type I addiction module toxin, SymE family [Dorea formicigenerans]|uniref:Type I addiction module toxin, SymE family n=2 Tax=Dorea formicigenerans TaxID=39486 RepID=A0A415MVL8_9FIRM|nr:type I addiction module toxin, SymE family [Dorea formicigenerans]